MTTVRRATPVDADRIAEIHVVSWRAAYRGVMPDALLEGLDVAERAAAWRKRIAGGITVLVVEDEGIRGFAAVGPSRDADLVGRAAEVYAIYLEASAWGRGLGRALLGRAIEGEGPVALWVLDANPRARRFYEAAGFRLDGAARPRRFGDRELVEVRYMLSPPSTSMVRPLK